MDLLAQLGQLKTGLGEERDYCKVIYGAPNDLARIWDRLLSTSASSFYSSSARASTSSANSRLVIVLPPMLTLPSCSSKASAIIFREKC